MSVFNPNDHRSRCEEYLSRFLRGRGTEERYCDRMGFDPDALPWYRALENLDYCLWVLKSGEAFVHHAAETLSAALKQWLDEA